MKLLVTGGAGYVGSHAVRALTQAGHEVCVLDNLSAGHAAAVSPQARLIVGDLEDPVLLDGVFRLGRFDAVMHFAAFIEVGESVVSPLKFYNNNVGNTVRLLTAMERHAVRRLVFSSTCAVYGTPEKMPMTEDTPRNPQSPYARAKLTVEWVLADSAAAWGLGAVALRYFNAAGAAADGAIGEDHDPETHLIPNVLKVALGQRECVNIFGTDYPTPDGTCVRDYVHVDDLAEAHLSAIDTVEPGAFRAYNAGTGAGASVREVVAAARQVTGHPIPVVVSPRRAGDVPVLCADATRIRAQLGWRPRHVDLKGIIASAWKWHKTHPRGFDDRPRE
ncbi:MAG: UDP-glucose 4-epimerase GalE [Planctomycetota bacterium]|nr:MAG: UDP-glucose 4-epimerase GalE [Planctomycetota bacterium]